VTSIYSQLHLFTYHFAVINYSYF